MASTTPLPPTISAIDAAQAALEHTRRALFPIRLNNWIVLGLLAFLDQCGRSLNSGAPGWNGRDHGPWRGPDHRALDEVTRAVDTATAWLAAHAALVTVGVLLGLITLGLLVAAVLWVNARGTFMYLDAVASGRTDLGRSWNEHARAADSYFGWRLAFALTALGVVLLAAGLVSAALVAFARGRLEGATGPVLIVALAPILLMLLVALPLLALAGMALRDFVAPLQLTTGLACGPATRVLEGLVTANPGAFIVYLLLKLIVVVLTGVIVFVGGCLTCCLGFFPVVLQTLFQPLFFFERAFPVFLLKQMGHDLPTRLGG